jgi:hypothetical protein
VNTREANEKWKKNIALLKSLRQGSALTAEQFQAIAECLELLKENKLGVKVEFD